MFGNDGVRTSRRIGVTISGTGGIDSCIRVYDIDTDEDLTERCGWVRWDPGIIKALIYDVDREGNKYILVGNRSWDNVRGSFGELDWSASHEVYKVVVMAALWGEEVHSEPE